MSLPKSKLESFTSPKGALRKLGHPHVLQEELQALSRKSRYAWSTVTSRLHRGLGLGKSIRSVFNSSELVPQTSDLLARYGGCWQSGLTIPVNARLWRTENHLTESSTSSNCFFSSWGAPRMACHLRQGSQFHLLVRRTSISFNYHVQLPASPAQAITCRESTRFLDSSLLKTNLHWMALRWRECPCRGVTSVIQCRALYSFLCCRRLECQEFEVPSNISTADK